MDLREGNIDMTMIKENRWVVFLGILILSWFAITAVAQGAEAETPVEVIKATVEQQFERNKAGLEIDKENWGLSKSDSFVDAALGDGIAYWIISTDYLEGRQTTELFSLDGHIFTITIGDKVVGIAKVQTVEGKSNIVEMSSYGDFAEDLTNAQKHAASNVPAKFIYDDRFHISGLAIANGFRYDFIPTQDNENMGLVKNERKSFDGSLEKIQQRYADVKSSGENMKLTGAGTDLDRERNLNYAIAGLVTLVVAAGTILYRRNRQNVGER